MHEDLGTGNAVAIASARELDGCSGPVSIGPVDDFIPLRRHMGRQRKYLGGGQRSDQPITWQIAPFHLGDFDAGGDLSRRQGDPFRIRWQVRGAGLDSDEGEGEAGSHLAVLLPDLDDFGIGNPEPGMCGPCTECDQEGCAQGDHRRPPRENARYRRADRLSGGSAGSIYIRLRAAGSTQPAGGENGIAPQGLEERIFAHVRALHSEAAGSGGPRGTRTPDPRIKSPMLYHLS